MIWDMATVAAIRGYRASGDIDLSYLHRHGEGVLNALGDRLYRELVGFIATSWPVQIDKNDCIIGRTHEQYTPMTATYQMCWHPTDRPGEVMAPGRLHDGMTVPPPDAIGNYYPPLRLPNDDPSIKSLYVADPITGEHPIITATNLYTEYEVTGWSDLHRRWIYTPKGNQ